MNQIVFPRKSYDGTILDKANLETWFCNKIESEIRKKLKQIDRTHLNIFEKLTLSWIEYSLHSLLLATPKRMERLTMVFDTCARCIFRKMNKDNRWEQTDFGRNIYKAFNYDGYRKNTLIDLAEKLNIKSCPYCNMHYTLFAENGAHYVDKLTKFQFDHFFDKSEYPFLSMSLYNLIPSCATCNQGKSMGHLSLKFHPYVSSISKQFHFEVANPLSLYSGAKKDRVEINVVPDAASPQELNKYDSIFHLQTLYRRHGDVAQEVFDKAYEEQYYLDTSSFKFLKGANLDYMLRLAYGTYMEEENIEKRPMSKFIQDIRKQAKHTPHHG